jgi:hypothetical protein
MPELQCWKYALAGRLTREARFASQRADIASWGLQVRKVPPISEVEEAPKSVRRDKSRGCKRGVSDRYFGSQSATQRHHLSIKLFC